jgi:hypothetical protein
MEVTLIEKTRQLLDNVEAALNIPLFQLGIEMMDTP